MSITLAGLDASRYTPVLEGNAVEVAAAELARFVFGGAVSDTDAVYIARLGLAAWFVWWSVAAAMAYRAGHWKSAVLLFAIGYEISWIGMVLTFAGVFELGSYFTTVLPVMVWSFLGISVLTGVLFTQHGYGEYLVGFAKLGTGLLKKRGWMKYLPSRPAVFSDVCLSR